MGNQSVSRFSDKLQWVSLSRKGCKEVIQSKSTREVIQKYTLEHIDSQEIKRQNLIYQWRIHKKASKFTVEIQEMKYAQNQDIESCFYQFCNRTEQNTHKLVVYTEQIHKLYQNNSKYIFKQKDQIRLFAEVLFSIDQLSQKFGYFMISKQMIGYNSKMTGKAWINENFASNYVQYKRQIHSKSERQKWEASIIQNIIDICRLCTIEFNSKSNKFQFVISQIRNNRLVSFEAFFSFWRKLCHQKNQKQRNQSLSLKKKVSSEQKSYKGVSNECSNSKNEILNSNGKQSIKEIISSTKDCKDTKILKQKRFVMVPVVNIKKIYQVSQQQRQLINDHIRKSDRFSRQNSLIVSPLKQNYVQVERHTQSYIKQKNEVIGNSEMGKPLDSILQLPLKSAQQFNDASDHMYDSSLISSPREHILMVDSMIVIENEVQNEQSFQRKTKIILEESVILRGHQGE